MSEEKRGKGRPRKSVKGMTQVTFTLGEDVVEYLNNIPAGRKSDFANAALREWIAKQEATNQKLREIACCAISRAASEGMETDDAYWMATGALIREARKQGIIGEELSDEMNATIQQVIKSEM